jgi:hypothetical protein
MPLKLSFRDLAADLDDWCRLVDLKWERLESSPMSRFGVRGENIEAFILPSLIAAAFWTGMPTLNRIQLLGVAVGLVTFVILIVLNRICTNAAQDLFVQVAFLFVLGGAIWIFGPAEAGTGSLVYRHLFIPVVLIVALALLLSTFLAGQLLRPLQQKSNYGEYLKQTELFQSRGKRIELASSRWVRTILPVFGVLLRPMELLLPVAGAVLLSGPAHLRYWAVGILLLMLAIVALSAFDERLDHSFGLITRRFFRNAALIVSLMAMALAAARLFRNTYVTTVFDSASGKEILLYFLAAYAVAWWYDYWTERLIGQQLFLMIDPNAKGKCTTNYDYTGSRCTSVPTDNRSLELHGPGRMLVYRPITGERGYFQAWSYKDFFEQLAAVGAPGGKAMPLPGQVSQRLTLYVGATALMAVGLLCTGGWVLHRSPENYELSVKAGHGTSLSLTQLLQMKNSIANTPVILVSASGGGTRAAVFTGAILEGLSETSGDAIRAGSGVSGGSAALAFYAGKRSKLVKGNEAAWNDYFDRLSMPYIRDVIERAQEWRMALHGRVGVLLAESFERRWGLVEGQDTFAQLTDFGLICNSTLAGQFDRSFLTTQESQKLTLARENGRVTLAEAEASYPGAARSDTAGGRLIMTNLDLKGAFSGPSSRPPFITGPPLPIVVDDASTRLQRAAALSANFPPVFSNAAVDVDDQTRYWVTDGGAADNRGLEPLLFALRDAVNKRLLDKTELPKIAVVIIEASAIDESFQQNRGVGSTFGAGAHFADQLDKELYDDLIDIYRSANRTENLHFYYIPMPRILRSSGSFGTHWMLQENIEVKNGDVKKSFEGTQVVRALRAAYGCRSAGDSSELVDWIRGSPEFKSWCEMRASLAPDKHGQSSCGCP